MNQQEFSLGRLHFLTSVDLKYGTFVQHQIHLIHTIVSLNLSHSVTQIVCFSLPVETGWATRDSEVQSEGSRVQT